MVGRKYLRILSALPNDLTGNISGIVTLVKKPPEASAPKPNNNAGFVHNLFHRKHDPLEYKAVLRKVKTVIQLT